MKRRYIDLLLSEWESMDLYVKLFHLMLTEEDCEWLAIELKILI